MPAVTRGAAVDFTSPSVDADAAMTKMLLFLLVAVVTVLLALLWTVVQRLLVAAMRLPADVAVMAGGRGAANACVQTPPRRASAHGRTPPPSPRRSPVVARRPRRSPPLPSPRHPPTPPPPPPPPAGRRSARLSDLHRAAARLALPAPAAPSGFSPRRHSARIAAPRVITAAPLVPAVRRLLLFMPLSACGAMPPSWPSSPECSRVTSVLPPRSMTFTPRPLSPSWTAPGNGACHVLFRTLAICSAIALAVYLITRLCRLCFAILSSPHRFDGQLRNGNGSLRSRRRGCSEEAAGQARTPPEAPPALARKGCSGQAGGLDGACRCSDCAADMHDAVAAAGRIPHVSHFAPEHGTVQHVVTRESMCDTSISRVHVPKCHAHMPSIDAAVPRSVVAMCAHAGGARQDPTSVNDPTRIFFVDTMALRLVTRYPEILVDIDEVHPHATIETVSGSIPVEYIGTAGINLFDTNGQAHYLEIPDSFISSKAKVDLYPVQLVWKFFGARHYFEDRNEIVLADGTRIPFTSDESGFPLKVTMGAALPGAIHHPRIHAQAHAAAPRSNTAYELIWRRLAYPGEDRWRAATIATEGIFPPSITAKSLPPLDRLSVPAILRGRMTAQPVFRKHHDLTNVNPGDQCYLDTCGPLIPSVLYEHTHIVGIICPASGYSRIFPCRSPSMLNATAALAFYIADLRSKLGKQKYYSPLVIRTDGGSAFIGHHFTEFCRAASSKLTYSAPRVPQQNSYAERLFGVIFPMARMLLASSGLSVRFHPWALLTANWIHNRMPSRSKDGKSPFEVLTGQKPNLQHLRAFGCAAAVFRSKDDRTKAKHEKKLTADRCMYGVYLGPSETMPAHTVFVLSPPRLLTSPHVIFNESTFPGEKKSCTDWSQVLSAQPTVAEAVDDTTDSAAAPATTDMEIPDLPIYLTDDEVDRAGAPLREDLGMDPLEEADADSTEEHGDIQPLALGRPQRSSAATTNEKIDRSVAANRAPTFATGISSLVDHDPRLAMSGLTLMSLISAARPSFAYLASSGPTALPAPDLNVQDCRVPKGYRQACLDPRSEYWIHSINKEWNGIMANDTLDFVKRKTMPPGANLMNSHFIFSIKTRIDGSIERFKSRLVADGNTQKHGVDYEAVFATVFKMTTFRMMLVLAARNDYGLWQLDIQQAFVQADLDPSSQLYMRVPPHLNRYDADGDELVCRLKKSLYGLKQAAREWSNKLRGVLVNFGFIRSLIDPCLYTYTSGNERLYLLSWVDDLVVLYSSKAILERFLKSLAKELPLDDRGELEWVLRMEIKRDRKGRSIILSQARYTEQLLDKYTGWGNLSKTYQSPMDDAQDLSAEHSPDFGSEEYSAMADKRATYMSVVGSLLWLSACTRPDLTYTTSILARFVSNPGQAHYKAMLRVLAYIHHTKDRVLLLAPDTDPNVVVYSDASWLASFSISGGLIYYHGCPVNWWSRRQRSVSHSSAEAEYFAASAASREGIYIRDLLEDLAMPVSGPTPLLLDSKAAINLASDPVAFKKTKHILRAAHELRDRVARGIFTARYVEAANQLADILTKPLHVHLHRSMLERILPMPSATSKEGVSIP